MWAPGSSRSPRPWQVSLTAPAAVDVPAVAMPFELRFGDVGDDVVVEAAGRFEVAAAAMGALRGMDVVFDEVGPRGRFGREGAGMLAMLLRRRSARAFVGSAGRPRGALAALADLLELVFQLGQAAAQLGVFRFQFGVALPKLLVFVHDPDNLQKQLQDGKGVNQEHRQTGAVLRSSCFDLDLTVTICQPSDFLHGHLHQFGNPLLRYPLGEEALDHLLFGDGLSFLDAFFDAVLMGFLPHLAVANVMQLELHADFFSDRVWKPTQCE